VVTVDEVRELAAVCLAGFDRRLHQRERPFLEVGVVVGMLDEQPCCARSVFADERAAGPAVLVEQLADAGRPCLLRLHLLVHPLPEGLVGVAQGEQLAPE